MRIIMCILMALASIDLSADQKSIGGLPDLEILTGGIFCNDQETLSYINKKFEGCMTYVYSISKECVTRYNKAIPDSESVQELLEHDVLMSNLTELYIMCVKAKIYEDIENVKFLENLGKNDN